jgi:mono/diheme cytochrome c family protein
MIYLDAADDNVSIARPIDVSVPSDSYDPSMMLFKGSEEEGKMNWTEPEPLKDSMSPYLLRGKTIFDANCAPCHRLDKSLTGPALRGTESRGPWRNRHHLFAFTRNPAAFLPLTCYTQTLVAQYNGQIMPAFPQLDDDALNAVYDYIRKDDSADGVLISNLTDPCADSCYQYDSVKVEAQLRITALLNQRKSLIEDNESRINYERWDGTGTVRMEGVENGTITKVVPENYKAIYYRFDIKSFGWYNIDAEGG